MIIEEIKKFNAAFSQYITTTRDPKIIEYFLLLVQLLSTTDKSHGKKQFVYPLLTANLAQIDDGFIQFIRSQMLGSVLNLFALFPEKREPMAASLLNLGNLIGEFPGGNRAINLEIAIQLQKIALKFFYRATFPQSKSWANCKNDLGKSHLFRIWGEKGENLEEAIRCFKAALEIHTHETNIVVWAKIQVNLGLAYIYRIRGKKEESLELAIRCLSEALEIIKPDNYQSEWIKAKINLSMAYFYRFYGEISENREVTIRCLLDISEVINRERESEQWAENQRLLSFAYVNRLKGLEEENLTTSIDYCSSALTVFTREAFSEKWAKTKINQGVTHLRLNRIRPRNEKNVEQAVNCFSDALQVFTREAFPQEYTKTKFFLGIIYQEDRQFQNAYTNFAAAIDVVEALRSEIIFGSSIEEYKLEVAEEWNKLYQRMVEVCVELGNFSDAIKYAESSKTRNLVERILSRDFKTIFPGNIANQLERLQEKIVDGQYQLQTATVDNPTALSQHLQNWRQQQNELQDSYFSVGYGFNFDKFQQSLDEQTGIIYWYITSAKLETFIITYNNIQRLILTSDADKIKALECWGNEYLITYKQNKNQWINTLASHLSRLASILEIDNILDYEEIKKCQRLILIPHRYLHLFPLHALPLTNGEFLCDRFTKGVGYAPSFQLLQLAQERGKNRQQFTRLFAIENPMRPPKQKPLLGSKLEIHKIRQHFVPEDSVVIAGSQASEATLTQRMAQLRSAHCVHFSCHGKFEPESPLESALKLADPDGNLGKEADLTLGKIFAKLDLDQCRLVTFSACESGMTDPRRISDEYIGLPSGFLYAGAPSVVSTLWTVDPLATTLLLTKFYHNLKRLPKLEAGNVALSLNQAQIWLRTLSSKKLARIEKSQKFKLLLEQVFDNQKRDRMMFNDLLYAAINRQPYPFANPYYWGCFVATGL